MKARKRLQHNVLVTEVCVTCFYFSNVSKFNDLSYLTAFYALTHNMHLHFAMVPWAHPSLHPKWHVDWFSRFCMGPKCCIMHSHWGRKSPKLPLLLGILSPGQSGGGLSHGHRQQVQKNGKDRTCGSQDIFSDRQTHRRGDHNTLLP